VYLSGVWVAALERLERMARAVGQTDVARRAAEVRARAAATLERRLWMPALGQYAFALLEGGRVNENLTAWPATAMAFGVFDRERGARMAARLASSEIMTDWGARPLAASSALFDPLHYNNGAVWPFVTGWVALAQYRYDNPHAGYFALSAIAATTFDEARGRNPEVISGRLYKALDTSVPQQFFATSMIVTPLLRGLLGIDVDATTRTLTLAPALPPAWEGKPVTVRNLAVGGSLVDARMEQHPGRTLVHVRVRGEPVRIQFRPRIPLGASAIQHAPARAVADSSTFTTTYAGGWSVQLPEARARIGERSQAVRVLRERMAASIYEVDLEGRAGSSTALATHGPGAHSVTLSAGSVTEVGAAAAGATRAQWRVIFPTVGANADGYVSIVARLTLSGTGRP
jgi:hypothetical protein